MLSCSVVSNSVTPSPMSCSPPGSSVHGDSPGKNTGVGCHALLQGIFPTQGSNPGLPHCMQILYHLCHQGNPWILEWVAYPFSRESSWPRNQTGVFCIADGFFTSWTTREAQLIYRDHQIDDKTKFPVIPAINRIIHKRKKKNHQRGGKKD